MIDELAEVTSHLNDDHADTVGLVGWFLASDTWGDAADRRDSVTATIQAVDPSGTDMTVSSSTDSSLAVRHQFSAECATIDQIRFEFFGLVNEAREWIGDELPITSLERELTGVGYTTFLSEVADVADVTPTIRQITFRGGLDDYVSLGGDEYLYVLLPPRGRSELTIGADFSWLTVEEMPESDRPAGAYYSVRRWRPDEHAIDMLFVLHDEGASSAWASQAEIGQPVGLWGPRRTFEPPASTGSYLFVVDETGFGATAAALDHLLADDAEVMALIVAEADGEAGRVEFPCDSGIDVTWVDRAGRPPGSTDLLIDAVRELDTASDVYAFGAGESRRITAVRRHLRDGIGLEAEQVSMTGYWRAC